MLVASCRVLPVDGAVADRAASIWAELPVRRRGALGDILIAATAVVHDLPLVTRNRRDFDPISRVDAGLLVHDWSRGRV